MPKHIKTKVLQAFHNFTSDRDYGFPIWDKQVDAWLTKRFGIYTDAEYPRFELEGMTFFFNWTIQTWMVK